MRRGPRSGGEPALPRAEARAAVVSAAALYLIGAALIGTSALLPHVSSPAGAAGVAAGAVVTAAALLSAVSRDRGGVGLAWAAELWGVALIVVLCASTGGPSSPFALLYFFAAGHAGAFQPRPRFIAVSVASGLAFLAPLLYAHVSTRFAAVALVGAVLALLTTAVIHVALERMREQRRRLELLTAATAGLAASLDPRQTLRRLASAALPGLADGCVVDIFDERGALSEVVAASVQPGLAARVEEEHRREPPQRDAAGPVAAVLATGRAQALAVPHESGQDPAALGRSGGVAVAAVPMSARGRLLGVASFLRQQPFDRGELALLEELTGRGALAYDNACLYAERAHVARTLRRSLMPAALPSVPGLEIEGHFRPMKSGSEVGGDFYDAFGGRDGLWMIVGDVCGKGAEAAVLTGFLRHTAVAYARESASPADVLTRLNQAMLSEDFDGRFATAILARLAAGERGVRLTIATAGHPSALVVRGDGRAEELRASGTLLGVFGDPRIEDSGAALGSGDALVLYTDGLTEARAPERVLTVDDLLASLQGLSPPSARAAIEALLALVEPADSVRDDIALLAARVA